MNETFKKKKDASSENQTHKSKFIRLVVRANSHSMTQFVITSDEIKLISR